MLTQHRPISISYLSTNLNLLSHLTTVATLYQRNRESFHLVLKNVDFHEVEKLTGDNDQEVPVKYNSKNLIWLEISRHRIVMTQQHETKLNYRHFWEKGVYGVSRYWLNSQDEQLKNQKIYLRNFTRNLTMIGGDIPESLRIDYELWSNNLNLGHYILHIEIN
jgi:hypothetical protein